MPPKAREPIGYRWFWAGALALVAAGSPWYLRPGSYEPVILGLPYWVWISIVLSIGFCLYVRWACLHLWRLAEHDEDHGPGSPDGEAE